MLSLNMLNAASATVAALAVPLIATTLVPCRPQRS